MTLEMGLESCFGMTSFPQVNIVGAHMSLPFQMVLNRCNLLANFDFYSLYLDSLFFLENNFHLGLARHQKNTKRVPCIPQKNIETIVFSLCVGATWYQVGAEGGGVEWRHTCPPSTLQNSPYPWYQKKKNKKKNGMVMDLCLP